MSSLWAFVASFALPVPLALLVLLNLPLPTPFRRGIFIFVSRVMQAQVLGIFRVLHFMLFVLSMAFLGAVRSLRLLHESHNSSNPFATAKYETMYLGKRWRAERNLWLAGFAFSMWSVLAVFVREMSRRMMLEERLAEFEMSGYTGMVDDTREASVSREVTSAKQNALSPRSISASPAKSAGRGGGRGTPPLPGAARAATPPVREESPAEVEMVETKIEKKDK